MFFTGAVFLRSLINLAAGMVQALLGLRLILKLFGANISAPFVQWIYDTTASLLYPFEGIFPSAVVGVGRPLMLEVSTIFAMVIYSLLAYVLLEVINLISARRVTSE